MSNIGKQKTSLSALISQLAQEERETTRFLAPFTIGARTITVRIAHIVTQLKIERPLPVRDGWYIFERTSPGACVSSNEASRSLLANYFQNLPDARFIYLGRFQDIDYGLQESPGSGGLQTEGPIPIKFLDNVTEFDSIVANFDGHAFYFNSRNRRRGSRSADALRSALANETPIDKLNIPSLLPIERTMYAMLIEEKLKARRISTNKNLDPKTRAELALGLTGTKLQSMTNQSAGTSRVVFEVDGRRQDVVVRTDTLQVVNSGICLAGRDSDFDLATLVTVFKSRNSSSGYTRGDRNEHDDPDDD